MYINLRTRDHVVSKKEFVNLLVLKEWIATGVPVQVSQVYSGMVTVTVDPL